MVIDFTFNHIIGLVLKSMYVLENFCLDVNSLQAKDLLWNLHLQFCGATRGVVFASILFQSEISC